MLASAQGPLRTPNYLQGANSAPISAPIFGTAQATVAAAFARWAAVTGLTLIQVPDNSDPAQAAGIRVGYASLNPGQTGTFSTTKLGNGALQLWTNEVNTVGRGAKLLAFSDSQENHRLTLSIAGDKYDAEATRLYKAAFNRAADAPGLTATRDALSHGASAEAVAQGFVNSSEFQRTYGALSATDFVTQLYRNVLGRAPDAGGLAVFTNALNSGASRGYALAGLSESDENKLATAASTHDGWVLTR